MIDAVSMISDNGQFFKQLTVEGSVITAGQVLLFLQRVPEGGIFVFGEFLAGDVDVEEFVSPLQHQSFRAVTRLAESSQRIPHVLDDVRLKG